jgi:hypothetical protein
MPYEGSEGPPTLIPLYNPPLITYDLECQDQILKTFLVHLLCDFSLLPTGMLSS